VAWTARRDRGPGALEAIRVYLPPIYRSAGVSSGGACGSSSSGPSFLTLPTLLSIGHIGSTSSGAGRSNIPCRFSEPCRPVDLLDDDGHAGLDCEKLLIGIHRDGRERPQRLAIRQTSLLQVPPKATGSPSTRATANGTRRQIDRPFGGDKGNQVLSAYSESNSGRLPKARSSLDGNPCRMDRVRGNLERQVFRHRCSRLMHARKPVD
jgi:hypothetical protein